MGVLLPLSSHFNIMARTQSLVTILLALPALALAQTAPNAGELLREIEPRPATPTAPQAPVVTTAPAPTKESADGASISVKHIAITGNTVIPTAELHALVAAAEGHTVTLGELRAASDRITQAYVARGYLLARAYLPAQEIKDGEVTMAVQDGRLGATHLVNTSLVSDPVVQRFLTALDANEVVATGRLEDVLLRLREVPGLQSAATLNPGAAPGTADLVVTTTPAKRISGQVTLDNSGGDSTGAFRLGALAEIASPFGLGDQLVLQGLPTLDSGEYLRYGRAAYDIAVGGRGLRVGAGYSHLTYELGQNFQALDAHGTADVAQLWITRPLLRTRAATVDFRVGYDYHDLDDQVEATSVRTPRHLHSGIVGLTASLRDGLLGGGTTSGSLTATYTNVDIYDSAARAQDAATAKTQGGAGKLEAQVERWQALVGDLSLYLRVRGQLATGNLDSADQIGASGPSAVRAYPQGELFGDEAILFTAELRHPLPLPAELGALQGAVFYDQGTVWTSQNPWVSGDNDRTLAGVGAGLRWSYAQHWSAQADAAWRTQGGTPSSAGAHAPQIWASLAYGF